MIAHLSSTQFVYRERINVFYLSIRLQQLSLLGNGGLFQETDEVSSFVETEGNAAYEIDVGPREAGKDSEKEKQSEEH